MTILKTPQRRIKEPTPNSLFKRTKENGCRLWEQIEEWHCLLLSFTLTQVPGSELQYLTISANLFLYSGSSPWPIFLSFCLSKEPPLKRACSCLPSTSPKWPHCFLSLSRMLHLMPPIAQVLLTHSAVFTQKDQCCLDLTFYPLPFKSSTYSSSSFLL